MDRECRSGSSIRLDIRSKHRLKHVLPFDRDLFGDIGFFCLTRVLSFIEIVGIKNVCAWKLRGHFYKVFFLSRSFCVSLSSIQDKDDFSF